MLEQRVEATLSFVQRGVDLRDTCDGLETGDKSVCPMSFPIPVSASSWRVDDITTGEIWPAFNYFLLFLVKVGRTEAGNVNVRDKQVNIEVLWTRGIRVLVKSATCGLKYTLRWHSSPERSSYLLDLDGTRVTVKRTASCWAKEYSRAFPVDEKMSKPYVCVNVQPQSTQTLPYRYIGNGFVHVQ